MENLGNIPSHFKWSVLDCPEKDFKAVFIPEEGIIPAKGKIDMKINRNYYGRQKESFQKQISVKDGDDFDGVFIRAPAITKIGSNAEAIAWENGQIVGCVEGKNMALTFHPELTEDLAFHKMWLEIL